MWARKFAERGRISYEIAGRSALFSDPVTSCGGEKISLEVPTNEALKAITKAIFWKPCLTYYIDRVRILNPISMSACGRKMLGLRGEQDLTYCTYLRNVRYQVEAHFEFNANRPEFESQWGNWMKYYTEFSRALYVGGRLPLFLGKSECAPTYLDYAEFGDGPGYYDNAGRKDLGIMYYGLTYPDEAYDDYTDGHITRNFYHCVMVDGVVEFPHPGDCYRSTIRKAGYKAFPTKAAGR